MPILGSPIPAANIDTMSKNIDRWRYNFLAEWKTLWEKEEIARDEQFLLFPKCFFLFFFQKLSVVDAIK